MLLFKPYHVAPILNGQKTQTRRIWKKKRCNIGSVHLAKTRMLVKEHFAKLRIKMVWLERLGDISKEDALKEGGYTPKEYADAWAEINGSYDPDVIVWVVEFEVAENKCAHGEDPVFSPDVICKLRNGHKCPHSYQPRCHDFESRYLQGGVDPLFSLQCDCVFWRMLESST